MAKIEGKLVRCAHCHKAFRREYIRKDHISPIGQEPCYDPIKGVWTPSWDVYISRVFSPPHNYQPLCLDCHDEKTKLERNHAKSHKGLATQRKKKALPKD